MRIAPIFVSFAVIVAACGGDTFTPANTDGGGVDGSNNKDATATDAGSTDSGSGQDGSKTDASVDCTPPGGDCATPCPPGTVCLTDNRLQPKQVGCTMIPPACNGTPTCACMAKCFCDGTLNKCTQDSVGLTCNSGTISRREFKKDIGYVSRAERDELADEALSIPLATYRYKVEADDHKKHLGFIIDDQPENSPAVQSDRTHVDEYGYTSMLLATVQKQQEEIDALNKRLAALEKSKRGQ